ncbi:RNA-directed DNA polymerase [Listeria newyorkensis]|uniref:RNA-directed DNA polymerase n=1 Tax=Listeria newyorkensis TaxID=1497681 RepID=A0A841YWQ6_9LIST|nr:RNA-directed DNA polymerase [Listeria newyorkensis]MBC1457016.1 RNA-directed DNA polymerase [Listeria newyorkensis]
MPQYRKYFTLENLVRYGYFEIKSKSNNLNQDDPYSQSSVIFQEVFDMEMLSQQSREIIELCPSMHIGGKSSPTVPIELSIYKNDEERRMYKMPNIYSYIRLALHIEENKEIYLEIIKNSSHSLSKYFYEKTFVSNKIEKETNRMGYRYIFKTDIQHFYPSIYTHSLPWVLAGKPEAKRTKKDKEKYYNQLDTLIQDCQYGETHGIPTGTMASRIVAEIFMCKIDSELSQYGYKRYVDDFELPYNDSREQVEFYNCLQKILGQYNLVIKKEKNIIDTYPFEMDNSSEYFFSYFSNLKGNDSSLIVRAKVHRYIEQALIFQKNGLKGAPKLVFKGLTNAINKGEITVNVINQPILSKLLNIVIMTPSTGAYMIDFFKNKNIDINETEINNNLTKHKELIVKNIKRFTNLNYNQELFSLLGILYYYRTENFLEPELLLEIIKLEDDFSAVLAMELFYDNYRDAIMSLFACIDEKLERTKTWGEEYWLFKYQFFIKIETDNEFKKYCKEYLFTHKNEQDLSRAQFFNTKNLNKVDSYLLRNKQRQGKDNAIFQFFEILLDKEITFLK